MMHEKPESVPGGGSSDRVSFLRMEKSILGEASPLENERLEGALARDARLESYFESMKRIRTDKSWTQVRLSLPGSTPRTQDRIGVLTEWIGRILPKPSGISRGLSVAFALAVLMVIPATWFATGGSDGVRSKGGGRPEIQLEIAGARVPVGARRAAKSGDVLEFVYRSAKPLYAQVWYIEDDGVPSRFEGKDDAGLYWPSTSAWVKAPQRIRLDGQWKAQRIVVLASSKSIPDDDVQPILSGRKRPGPGIHLYTFNLAQL